MQKLSTTFAHRGASSKFSVDSFLDLNLTTVNFCHIRILSRDTPSPFKASSTGIKN